MNHTPRINEEMARLPGFAFWHPMTPEVLSQGSLELLWRMEQALIELTGLARVTLQPAAGAQGELAGILMVRKALEKQGNPRKYVLIPDSAHGTNPASAHFAGYLVREGVGRHPRVQDLVRRRRCWAIAGCRRWRSMRRRNFASGPRG